MMSDPATSLIFRPLEHTDRDELSAMIKEAFGGAYTADEIAVDVDMSFTPHVFAYHFFVGRENGKIVCAGALKRSGLDLDLWGIAWITVAPARQKQGYGRGMVSFLLTYFGNELLKGQQGTVILISKQHNFAFYEALGFSSVQAHDNSRLFYTLVNRPNA